MDTRDIDEDSLKSQCEHQRDNHQEGHTWNLGVVKEEPEGGFHAERLSPDIKVIFSCLHLEF